MTVAKTERKDELEEVPSDRLRDTLGGLIDRVLAGERIVVTRHGRRVLALVGLKDLEALESGRAS
jgi:prevent-host-death family protein